MALERDSNLSMGCGDVEQAAWVCLDKSCANNIIVGSTSAALACAVMDLSIWAASDSGGLAIWAASDSGGLAEDVASSQEDERDWCNDNPTRSVSTRVDAETEDNGERVGVGENGEIEAEEEDSSDCAEVSEASARALTR